MGNIKHYHCNRSLQADAGKSSEVTRLHPQSDGNCCEQRDSSGTISPNDPVLRNIAMALGNGLQAGRSDDPMYGKSLSKALAMEQLPLYPDLVPRNHLSRFLPVM